jgi:hypothetical protein
MCYVAPLSIIIWRNMDVIGNKLAKVSILLAFGLAIVLFGCIVPFLYMIEIIY